jgi:magnesium-transporting ATPase (P-type)
MLWANLVMDILAAIALGTERWVDTTPNMKTDEVVAKNPNADKAS